MENIIESTRIDTESIVQLSQFLSTWEKSYLSEIKKISMFDPENTKQWSQEQKEYFAKTFYHARGHFNEFLWFMGNFSPTQPMKQIVLDNIAEEFGGRGRSHEQMYMDFAKDMGTDIRNEVIKQETYLPFLREFNAGHLEWLDTHDSDCRIAAFSAYEKLDNIDYVQLLQLAESLGTSKVGLIFFKVHNQAKHFEKLSDDLINIWINDRDKVKMAFSFISVHQLKMWEQLSEEIFNYPYV